MKIHNFPQQIKNIFLLWKCKYVLHSSKFKSSDDHFVAKFSKYTIVLLTELPNVQRVACTEAGLKRFDACLSIQFRQRKEFAGLKKADGSSYLMTGELYSTKGKVKDDSRVVYSRVDKIARKRGYFNVSDH